jgi:condensin complex subunit 3
MAVRIASGVSEEDISTLYSLMGEIFDKAQRSTAVHRKLVVQLGSLQSQAVSVSIEDVFNSFFITMINRILPIRKSEACAERIVRFCEEFVAANEKDWEFLINHLRKGIHAKDKNVRMRSCQLIAVTISRLGEISDVLYEGLTEDLLRRIYDKEAPVRLQAALALCRLQGADDEDESGRSMDETTKLLVSVLQHDPSAEVRRAVLFNLQKSRQTLPFLLERAWDVHPTNRRCVYSRTMKEIGDFRLLSIGMREKILQWGLQDRDSTVRAAATKMFVGSWLEKSNNDLVELLERLDVLNSKVAEVAMDRFFEARRDTLDKMSFPDEFWQRVTAESVFLVRSFNQYCVENKLNELLESKLPELTKLAFLVEKYLDALTEPEPELEFIVEQLLLIMATYDFGDEIGRRKTLGLLRAAIVRHSLNDAIIKTSMVIIRKISVSERDFSQLLLELLADIKDEVEETSPTSENHLRALHKCLSVLQS